MKTKSETGNLTGRQRRYLRGLGHHLQPLLMLGREGINNNVLIAAKEALGAHELIKVKIGNGCPLARSEAAAAIAAGTGAEIVQVLGKTFLIFRENPDRPAKDRIRLPQ